MVEFDIERAFKWGLFERILLSAFLLTITAILLILLVTVIAEHGYGDAGFGRATKWASILFISMIIMMCFGRPLTVGLGEMAHRLKNRVVSN